MAEAEGGAADRVEVREQRRRRIRDLVVAGASCGPRTWPTTSTSA
ncbi:hypothetical protein [Streptomyces alboflavus]